MPRLVNPAILFIFILLLSSGCSGTSQPISPSQDLSQPFISSNTPESQSTAAGDSTRQLWSFNLIFIDPTDPQNIEYEIVPVRQATTHWNVLKWLEKTPCTSCLKILDISPSDHASSLVTVSIKHPFSTPNLTGFDVRGIAMFRGSYTFPGAALTVPDRGLGDGELLNADGFTTLYNFSTVGKGPSGLQGYLKGKFATATLPNAKLNGFLRYTSSNPANTREAFYAGDMITRTFDIDMPGSPFIMGYAVDASWVAPASKPVDDPMADFPPEANCQEPYAINIEKVNGILHPAGGFATFSIDCYDHQGNVTFNDYFAECPELFYNPPVVFTDGNGNYFFTVSNEKHAPVGKYKVLVSFKDPENLNSPSWINLTAYQVVEIDVVDDYGWVKTWGGSAYDRAEAVCTDSGLWTYVVGEFSGSVDFDPGPGTFVLTSVDNSLDAFLAKFDPVGNFVWAKSWGGDGSDLALDVALYNLGVIVVGSFENSADFDPGPEMVAKATHGEKDIYMSVFYSSGGLDLVKTWGGVNDDEATAVGYIGYNRIVAGYFQESVQFPSETGFSNGGSDIFVLTDGDADTLMTLGGSGDDKALGLAIGDSSVCVTGTFENGFYFAANNEDYHMSNGSMDAFLIRYHLHPTYYTLSYSWSRTWGGTYFDYGNDVALNLSNDDIYVAGSFIGKVNFNTGPVGPVDNHTSTGFGDASISHFSTDNQYLGTTTWGGLDGIFVNGAYGVSVDSTGNVYSAGGFIGSTLGLTSKGQFDCIVAKYNPDLDLIYARSWGGSGADSCEDLVIDMMDRLLFVGNYKNTVDFNPGSGVDNHISTGGSLDSYLMKMLPGGSW